MSWLLPAFGTDVTNVPAAFPLTSMDQTKVPVWPSNGWLNWTVAVRPSTAPVKTSPALPPLIREPDWSTTTSKENVWPAPVPLVIVSTIRHEPVKSASAAEAEGAMAVGGAGTGVGGLGGAGAAVAVGATGAGVGVGGEGVAVDSVVRASGDEGGDAAGPPPPKASVPDVRGVGEASGGLTAIRGSELDEQTDIRPMAASARTARVRTAKPPASDHSRTDFMELSVPAAR
jgi:hypothetical protein